MTKHTRIYGDNQLPTYPDSHYENLVARWKSLAQVAAGIVPTKLPLEPSPDDIFALREDLEVLADNVDAVIRAQAEYFEAMTGHKINRVAVPVDNVLRDALDGMLLYEIESAADQMADDLQQQAYYARHNAAAEG